MNVARVLLGQGDIGDHPGNLGSKSQVEVGNLDFKRMLDADEGGADWRAVARIVLHIDPDREPDRAWQASEIHLCGLLILPRKGGKSGGIAASRENETVSSCKSAPVGQYHPR